MTLATTLHALDGVDSLVRPVDAILDNRHAEYRVLRRLPPFEAGTILDHDWLGPVFSGVYLDFETTGKDAASCKPIALAMVRFQYSPAGRIVAIEDLYEGLQDPGELLAPEITGLTGITDEMLHGQAFSMARIMRVLDGAELLLAHNASFDRQVAERQWGGEVFHRRQAWACSWQDVDWKARGYRCGQLPHLVSDVCLGFYDAHRALDDVMAGIHLLRTPAPLVEGEDAPRSYFSHLLDAARRPTHRIWATGSKFSDKDALKRRGYKWDGDRQKCWYLDAIPERSAAEVAVLLEHFGVKASVQTITAYDRYSVRG